MRHFVVICILLLCIHYSMQVPKYENCDRQVLKGDATKDCVLVTCLSNKKDYNIQGCDAITTCKSGKQEGYHNGDPNAEYPGCCSGPRCKN